MVLKFRVVLFLGRYIHPRLFHPIFRVMSFFYPIFPKCHFFFPFVSSWVIFFNPFYLTVVPFFSPFYFGVLFLSHFIFRSFHLFFSHFIFRWCHILPHFSGHAIFYPILVASHITPFLFSGHVISYPIFIFRSCHSFIGKGKWQ